MITAHAETQIAKPPAEVFDFLDDLTKTPQWNKRCIELKQTSPGPRNVGAELLYRYKEPGREGTMPGKVTEYVKPTRLAMRFVDKMVAVEVLFELSENGSGTHLEHSTNIEPLSMFTKMMAAVIRPAAQKESAAAVVKIKELLES